MYERDEHDWTRPSQLEVLRHNVDTWVADPAFYAVTDYTLLYWADLSLWMRLNCTRIPCPPGATSPTGPWTSSATC